MSGIKVFLTNGDRSDWLALPATPETAREMFHTIGSENESIRITSCVSDYGGKLDSIIVGGNLDSVNYLAVKLSGLSSKSAVLMEAILDSPLCSDIFGSISKAIDFADNIGAYEVYRGVKTPEDLARYYIEKSGQIQMPPEWVEGIDLERFGKNLEKHEPGYYTSNGYLIATGLDWKPSFENNGKIPDEYCIMLKTK